MDDAREQLVAANAAITTAVMLLSAERGTFEQFMREARDMDNFGHITDPTLFISSERRATEAILKPLYQAALDFIAAYDRQIAAARGALDKVNADG